ncbi:putative transcription factor MYB-HB-like family [Helianthus anomalus]
MEENRKLRERVKILKDFQTACRTKTGRALSQKKDARIQLISVFKQRGNASKVKDKNALAIYQGPAENSHVAHYKDAVSKYPFSLTREPWSKEEKENLLKGIRQQFQKMLMDNVNLLRSYARGTEEYFFDASVGLLFSCKDLILYVSICPFFFGGDADPSCWVNMVAQIKDHKITHEEIKSFLKDVRWKDLASMYVTGRSGAECESRWRNCEDPLINHGPWTTNEDKKLLHIVSNRGISNWIEIASELNTNRTPFQCLSRFQRSLNASIIKNEWTPSDDEELRKAVAEYGETNWQLVASTLEGRTGTQCSNRWKKSLNPQRERVGKWDPYEDKCLKVVVSLFGAKNWNKIAKFVPGRTQVQCRERYPFRLDTYLSFSAANELNVQRIVREPFGGKFVCIRSFNK